MRAYVWILGPILALSAFVGGCGDDDGGKNDDADAENDEGDDTARAGSSGSGAGGRGGSGSGASGSPSTGSGGKSSSSGGVGSTVLSDIDTDAEARAVCELLLDVVEPEELSAPIEGLCTVMGVLAGLSGGDCEQTKAECLADEGTPSTDPAQCTAEDGPQCDGVTVDEYVACTAAQMKSFTALYDGITCESEITSLPTMLPPAPAECVSVYTKCPDLAPSTNLGS